MHYFSPVFFFVHVLIISNFSVALVGFGQFCRTLSHLVITILLSNFLHKESIFSFQRQYFHFFRH